MSKKKTTHMAFALSVKPEIINISLAFVAGFWNLQKKKTLNGTVRKKLLNFSTGRNDAGPVVANTPPDCYVSHCEC
jgi:hypothetical protein